MRLVEYLDYMSKDRPFGNSASALVIDRQCFQAVGGWPEELFPLEDQDLVIRLGDSGKTVQVLSPATILHRAHPGNTVNSVAPFLHSLRQIIRRERMGRYPGGKERRLERYGLLGGLVFFWAKRAVKCGLCAEALKLVAHGWQMALVGATRRVQAVLCGQRPCEALAVAVSTLARETPLGAASKL
jgi:GT2 family glycosyltransferase